MKSLGKGIVSWSYHQYRENAKKEYSYIWRALFREFIQNSSDAKATEIHFLIDEKSRIIRVSDNGSGMDLDVIQNRLLFIGGSKKEQGSIGGLGKAKELLFFSHPQWEVITNQHVVTGEGGEYEIFENSEPISGTTITLTQSMDDNIPWPQLISALRSVVSYSNLDTKVFLMTEDSKEELPKMILGHFVKDVMKNVEKIGQLYFRKDPEAYSSHMHVQINGCWMFDKYIGETGGQATLNLDSAILDPIKCLTANRDSFRNDYQDIIDELVAELIVDKRSGTAKYKKPEVTLIRGTGQIEVSVTREYINALIQSLKNEAIEIKDLCTQDPLGLSRINALIDGTTINIDNMHDIIERYMQIIGYEPNFIIREYNNDSMTRENIQRWLKTKKASTIAKVWTETLKQVLLDNEIPTRFTAGFLFDEDIAAARTDDSVYGQCFLINPLKVPQTGVQNKVEFMNYMRTTAIHEINHMNYSYHDEDFMLSYHNLESHTWSTHRIYAAIGKLR
jgi:hypothetical protein